MINKCILIGNLGRDPEITRTESGLAIAKFSIATTDKRKVGDEYKEETEWHNITVFGKVAEICEKYLTKGRSVYVDGRLKTDSWDDKKTGEKKYRTGIIANEVKFLGGKSEGKSSEAFSPNTNVDLGEIPF